MKKHNLSWVAALLVFGLLAMCTAATPGKIADPANYTCAVYSTMLSLLPPVIAIVLALITKEVYTSLLVGIASGALLYANGNLELAVNTLFFHTEGGMVYKLADPSNVGILVFLVMLGILVALMNKAGGSAAFGRWASSHIHTRAGAQLATLMLGVLIFVDDYLNIMTLSTCMRKLTDRQKVPRETLSYIIDSTGAPVCALLPFSTWAVFFAGLFYAEAGIPELGYGSAINTFCAVIPFIFYAIAAVALVPLFSLGLVPKLGRMKKAYRRVEETGKVYSPESAELNLEDEDDSPAITGCLWDFVLPIGTLIALTIVGGELFLALVAAIAVCFLLYIPRKKLSLTRFCDLAMHGFCNMIPTVAIIFFAFVMQEGMTEIGIAPFVINAVKSILSPAVFPAIAFLVVAALNFTTGSVWGITAVTVPILLPLAFSIGANPLLVMGAIVSGATLGSHACFYSDATVLTSSCCKMENMDHALSQLPYSLCAAGLSAAGYLVCGLLM